MTEEKKKEEQNADLATTKKEKEWLSAPEFAKKVGVCANTARKILRAEKTGVHLICTPGHTRETYKVHVTVVARFLRRTTPA